MYLPVVIAYKTSVSTMESVLENSIDIVVYAGCSTRHYAYLFMPLLLRRRANIRIMVNNQSAAIASADAQVMNH